jgi:creatinine amidohydrolase
MMFFHNLTWKKVEALDRAKTILILPLGSVEPHGPHGPLCTDLIISTEMAKRTAKKLNARGLNTFLLPPICYTVTTCASGFPGAVSISQGLIVNLIAEVMIRLIEQGFQYISIANAHFEPGHVQAIYDGIDRVREKTGVSVTFPDLTRKKYYQRLVEGVRTTESHECHAGCYETSLVMAVDPSLVDEEVRTTLLLVDVNLVQKIINEGIRDFKEMGMNLAYCGDPSIATREEGELIYEILSDIMIETILDFIEKGPQVLKRGAYGIK